jgi:hypothetical protein
MKGHVCNGREILGDRDRSSDVDCILKGRMGGVWTEAIGVKGYFLGKEFFLRFAF